MKKLKTELTSTQIQYLKNQRFGDNEPGTLLKDFSSLLDFIGTTGIPVSKKNHLFAIKLLPQLNQLLSNPLDVKLKRPQQKSFPHINGLYLLLRASGLAHIVYEKKETKLMLDSKILADWKSMNSTECYFALFYAWWHRGSGEIVGEPSRAYFDDNFFYKTLDFFLNNLGDGLDVKKNVRDFYYLRYRPGHHNLALMELFGFIRIEQDAALTKENWSIVKIEPTPWGSSLLNYFSRYTILNYFSNHTISLDESFNDSSENHQNESWGSELKTYIPNWKKNLVPPDTVVIEGSVIIKVILGKVYRKIAVPIATSLDELAEIILRAFGFSNDHLYEFIYKNRYGITERVVHPYTESDDDLYTSDCIIGELPLYEGMEITFHFDFGDNWRFQLVMESIANGDISFSEPEVIEKHGKPPEQYPDW